MGAKGEAGPTGADGEDGPTGPTGPAGPTEGASTDGVTLGGATLTPESTYDASVVTTTRAGRLLVSKSMSSMSITCLNGLPWRAWLVIDGVRVPGTVFSSVPSGTPLRPITLTGVTAATVRAGAHDIRLAADCIGDSVAGGSTSGSQNATVVVLG